MSEADAPDHLRDRRRVDDDPMTAGPSTRFEPHAGKSALWMSLRQGMLRPASSAYSIQNHLDLADIAHAAGLRAASRLLYELAFLRLGFSPSPVRRQIAIAERSGLWSDEEVSAWPRESSATGGFILDMAIAELRTMIDARIMSGRLPFSYENLTGGVWAPSAIAEPPAARQPTNDVAADCAALCSFLRSRAAPDGIAAASIMLATLKSGYLARPPIDLAAHACVPVERLIEAFTYNSLRLFLNVQYRLGYPPLGSPALLQRAARLDPAGLGAYFTNISCLIRTPADLFGLIYAAAGGAVPDELSERWVFILSMHLGSPDLQRTVDMLADLGFARAVWGILAAAAREPDARHDHHLLFSLRDAGLDTGDMRLAAEAQRIVALDRRDADLEWRILGDIYATAGETALARQAYAASLAVKPRDIAIMRRVKALKAAAFAPFAVRRGFGQHSRARQGGALDVDPDAVTPADP